MNTNEVVDQVCAAASQPDFASVVNHLQPHLSVEVMLRLAQRINHVAAYDPHDALKLAEASLQVADLISPPMARMYAQWASGWVLHVLGQNEKALQHYNEVIEYLTEQRDWRRLAGATLNQLSILVDMGRFEEAFATEPKIRKLCELAGESARSHLIKLETHLGHANTGIGRLQDGLLHARAGFEMALQMEEKTSAVALKMLEGRLLYELDDVLSAESSLTVALELAKEINFLTEVGRILMHLGLLAHRKGDYQTALTNFEKSEQVYSSLKLNGDVAYVNCCRANVYLQLNLLEETVKLSEVAEQSSRERAMASAIVEAMLNRSHALMKLGEELQAKTILNDARLILADLGAEWLLALTNLQLGRLTIRSDQISAARQLGLSVLAFANSYQYQALIAESTLLLAECDFQEGELTSAETHLQTAQSLADQYNLCELVIQACHLAGLIQQKTDPDAAYREFEQAVEKIAAQNANLLVDEFRIGYLSDKIPIYDAYIASTHERVHNNALPAHQLLFALDEVQTAPLSHVVADEEVYLSVDEQTQLHDLRTEWNWYQTKLDRVGLDSSLRGDGNQVIEEDASTHEKLRTIEHEIAEMLRRQRIRAGADSSVIVSDVSDAVQLQTKLQACLQHDEVLLQYYVADDVCHALLLTTNGITIFSDLIDFSAVETFLETWRFYIQNTVPMQTAPLPQLAQLYLGKLYDGLFRPISPTLTNVTTLNIILPTEWHDLPMAALFDGQQYLVEQFALTHLSAPNVLMRRQVGQPEAAIDSALLVGYSDGGRLPETLQESFKIHQALPPQWQVTHLTEESATEQLFRQHCQQASLIHLATHATFRADNPLFSSLRFADRHITVTDMYDMNLQERPLVVLSACETGRGKARGGGVLGMGRGLLAAGASQVVLSRWQLEDAASAELMQAFYHYLNEDRNDVATALRQAQVETLAQHPHPFFWASYMFTPG